MTHREKVRWMMKDLEKRGVGRWTSAPPLFRIAWRLGARIRPPLFLPARTLILVFGGWMTVCLTPLLVLSPRRRHPSDSLLPNAWTIVLVASLAMGLWMAAYYRRRAFKLELRPWASYGFDTRAPEVFS